MREWADTGVITCVIDQTCRYQGRDERVIAPTTLLLRREAGDWRIALMHTVPLPEASQDRGSPRSRWLRGNA